MKVKVINKSKHRLPEYATSGRSGFDFKADIDEPWVLHPGETLLVPTGLIFAVPKGYELQVRARSGLALKHNIGLMNGIGTIDSDFRSPVGIILHNYGTENFVINPGDRIAQGVICPVIQVEFAEVLKLDETKRGTGGFGSTGIC